MKTIEAELNQLELDLTINQRKLEALRELASVYPDLKVHVGKDGLKVYCSESINEYVNDVELKSTCECCDGAALLAHPFCVVSGVKVYSDPPHFKVGFANRYGFGVVPDMNWKRDMKEQGLNRLAIDKVDNHMRKHPPVDYDLD